MQSPIQVPSCTTDKVDYSNYPAITVNRSVGLSDIVSVTVFLGQAAFHAEKSFNLLLEKSVLPLNQTCDGMEDKKKNSAFFVASSTK